MQHIFTAPHILSETSCYIHFVDYQITTKIPKVPKLPLYLEAPSNASPHDIVSAVGKKARDALERSAFPRECLPLSSKHQENDSQSEDIVNPAGDHMLETSDQTPKAPPIVEDEDGKAFFMTQVYTVPENYIFIYRQYRLNTPRMLELFIDV